MVTRCDAGVDAALDAGVPACMVRLAGSALRPPFAGPPGAAMRVSCAECLAQLSHHGRGKAAILEAGGIDVLAQLLGSDEAVAKAVHALMGVTTEVQSKLAAMQAAGTALVALLKRPGPVADDCRAVLLNVAEHPEARKLLALHLPDCERERFLGALPLLPPDYRMSVVIPKVGKSF